MIRYHSIIDLDEAEEIERKMTLLINHAAPVLLVDSSNIKCKQTIKSLNDAGFFNITVLNDFAKIEKLLLGEHPYTLVIFDGDIGDNECFKIYLSLKQKSNKIPKTIFLKENVDSKVCEIYKKGGSLGCISKPFAVSSIRELLHEENPELLQLGNVDCEKFGEVDIIKLSGKIEVDHLIELGDLFATALSSDSKRCILDCSKAKTIDASFEKLLKTLESKIEGSDKIIEIFDPKKRLYKIPLDAFKGVVIV
jgi:ABC-type transporter Mla MlaB component